MKLRYLLTILCIGVFLSILGCSQFQSEKETPEVIKEETKEIQSPPFTYLPYFQAINMVNKMDGWAIVRNPNLKILKTSDGGLTWKNVTPDLQVNTPYFVYDESHAWFTVQDAGMKKIIYTFDGGKTWTESIPLDSDSQIIGLHFVDTMNGWITNFIKGIGAGGSQQELAKSTDGGQTWNILIGEEKNPGKLAFEGHKSHAVFSSLDVGWIPLIAFGEPWLYNTSNGGESWEKKQLPITEEMPKGQMFEMITPSFFNHQGVLPIYYVGDDLELYLYLTKTEGKSWDISPKLELKKEKENTYNVQVDVTGPTNTWVLLNKKQIYMIDRTNQWIELNSITPLLKSGERILAFDFVDEKNGWLVVEADQKSQMYRTSDGGETWNLIEVQLGKN